MPRARQASSRKVQPEPWYDQSQDIPGKDKKGKEGRKAPKKKRKTKPSSSKSRSKRKDSSKELQDSTGAMGQSKCSCEHTESDWIRHCRVKH